MHSEKGDNGLARKQINILAKTREQLIIQAEATESRKNHVLTVDTHSTENLLNAQREEKRAISVRSLITLQACV